MTKEVDYISKTLAELQEIHSRLCAEADGLGLELPESLTVDFDAQERGAEICRELDGLVAGSRANSGVAGGSDIGHTETDTKPAKKRAARKAATEEKSTGVSQMTDTTKKAKSAKKVAKKAAKKIVKKAAAKKNGVAKKTSKPRAAKGTGPVAKVIALLKSAKGCTRADILKATGWKAVSVQQVAAGAGLKLKVDESARPFKYKAA